MEQHSQQIQAIAWVNSPYKEKFGAPRQPGEVEAAVGLIHFHKDFNPREAFKEIESFSHLWLLFLFHECIEKDWSPTVRPPRLGGNQRVGVYASRSPFRPNSIGLSAVKNLGLVEHAKHGLCLKVGGLDLIDQTPIVDIKPYLPHADSIPNATSGYAPHEISHVPIIWRLQYDQPDRQLIEQTLRLNPVPGYQTKTVGKEYGITIGDKNIHFISGENDITITSIKKIDT